MPGSTTAPSARSPGRSRRRSGGDVPHRQQQQQQQPQQPQQPTQQPQPQRARSPQTSPRALRAGTVPTGLVAGCAFAAYAHASPEPSALPMPPMGWLVSAARL